MTVDFWKDKYPTGIPREISTGEFTSILDVFEASCKKFGDLPAFSNLGQVLTYRQLDQLSSQFAAYLQNETDLKPGDRIAIQMPNILQFPIATFGALRAGLIVVNTNPLYTEREMEHQFNDSGAKALVVLANMAHLAEDVVPKTQIKHVIVTQVGDMLPLLKRVVVNCAVKYLKKMVPSYYLPQAVGFLDVLSKGKHHSLQPHQASFDDVAILQYTGGTTGVAKGAMLTHRNIVANMFQCKAITCHILEEGKETVIAPLPLYHIYAFTFHCMVGLFLGLHNVLITNPRDLPGFIDTLEKQPFTVFVGLNTLFVGLMNNERFRQLNFKPLKLTLSGGMALQLDTANRWEQLTGCKVCEGYGMTETSPVVSTNPLPDVKLGSIGMPIPSTEIKLCDDEGNDLPFHETGELCVRGPQVMKGYWNREEETAKVLSEDGWLKTGDIATVDEQGYIKIVDRKKDMIVVSGFNVYPNELEDELATHPDVLQCAAIGVPSEKTGEAIKMFVVSKNPNLTQEELVNYLKERVTGYKVPRVFEFRDELPTTNVGKILRRELRDQELLKLKKAS
ncbi:AMP-binding protein [Endozoicomonas sp. SM1973]|uniref:Long-chain-fatty-acid--CoA ligase n=1 Tax=Spartinivicinus marinus TaxID=2994442 RepID=A0A853HX51_9GAMM|nr:AMP-binding protein [Spartinivicinus marinus]MCX4029269.1 AMP-binding protein [Spartinivicinus marinus]NYZ65823.1 AMP-binding protein [Spartinivicinus marinus]